MGEVEVTGTRIGWGVLGAAGIARRRFLPALEQARNGHLVALGSRSPDRAAALAPGSAVGSYEDVLADPAVDAVYVPLPNGLHGEWVRRALAAGKHVLCEKPLVLRAAEAEEIAVVAAAAGRVVMEGFMYRLHPQYEPAVWEPLVERIGRLRAAYVRRSFTLDSPGDYRADAALGGGAIWDIGCYCLDLVTRLCGAPVEVHAMGDLRRGVEWTSAVQLRFPSGVLGSAWWSFAGPLSQRLSLVGELGTLELDAPFRSDGPSGAWLDTGDGAQRIEFLGDDCFRREIEHFGDVVLGGVAPAVPLGDSARWLRVAEVVERQVRVRADQAAAG
jgi:D-xylose 1-dehydrogenase (NADP+, D-xylono-1,5-lactone-forming)